MVSKCGSEISGHIPAIVDLCLEYITYDPNYNYDDGDDSDMECDDGNGILSTEHLSNLYVIGEDDTGSDDEYSDDDDVSWKVRRAAAKCIEAVIVSRHEMIEQFYRTISPALINRLVHSIIDKNSVRNFLCRFKEREENVKADIFHAYQALLRQTKPSSNVTINQVARSVSK